MINIYSKDLLVYLSGLLGFILVVVGIVMLFGYGMVGLYELLRSEKKWEEVRKQFTRKLSIGLDFVIAAHVTFVASSPEPQALTALFVLALVRTLVGYSIVKETKA